jgi:hypothetical protein
VLEAIGEWRLDGQQGSVVAGEGLAAGAQIVALSNQAGNVLTIVRDADLSRSRTICDASPTNPCRLPVAIGGDLTAASASPSPRGVMKAFLGVLLDKPPAVYGHYALTLTRGKRSFFETEAVVALDPAVGLFLPPAPPEMRAGPYTVSVAAAEPKSAANGNSSVERSVTLRSDGTWRAFPFTDVGLVSVSIENEDGDQVADELVFVVRLDEYAAESSAFDAVRQRTAPWTGPSARDDEHVMLRSYLLARYRRP